MFYNLFLLFYFLLFLPKFFWERFFFQKKRSFLLEKLGLKKQSFFIPKNKKVIWLHAVSIGETKAATSLVKKIKIKHPNCFLIVSSITTTGHNEAKKSLFLADKFVFLPFDFSWTIKKVLRETKPEMIIVVETDFWFNFLKIAKSMGSQICLVSGKISQKSLNRWKKVPFLAKKMFSLFDIICVQNNLHAHRFLEIGIEKKKIKVTGNLKYENAPTILSDDEKTKLKSLFKIRENDFVITIGSTHAGEEKMLLDCFSSFLKQKQRVKLLIVPRHPERFNTVEIMLKKKEVVFSKFSEKNEGKDCQVLLIDSMGLLNACYQLSNLAIVGGSFIEKIGGHNILEPLFFHVPVVFGPYMHAQDDLKKLILKTKCGMQVKKEEIPSVILHFFENIPWQKQLNENAKKLIKNISGSLDKTFAEISFLFSKF